MTDKQNQEMRQALATATALLSTYLGVEKLREEVKELREEVKQLRSELTALTMRQRKGKR